MTSRSSFINPRKTSEWQLNSNSNVSTVADTYETVYSYTGAGLLVAVSAAASVANIVKTHWEITVDGGTLYELDMATHFIKGSDASTWSEGSNIGTQNFTVPVNQDFGTSILVRAKNDTDTGVIACSVSSSEDI